MDFYGMEKPFYYIDKGKFRFIFLDSNHYVDKDGQTKDYHKRDYARSKQIDRYSPEEVQWLEKALQPNKYAFYSHMLRSMTSTEKSSTTQIYTKSL